MPYINQKEREKFNKVLKHCPEFKDKGELEYAIFFLMQWYMDTREDRYSNLHDCVYAATHCADEFRRRFLDSHEDSALVRNGEVSVSLV